MTEEQWLVCVDPDPLLAFLREKASERKLRLFAVACCRRVWHLLQEEKSQQAIEVLERWVDGEASRQELIVAHELAWKAWGTPARTAVADATSVVWGIGPVAAAASHAAWAGSGGSRADERKTQARVLRCIVGNPFCPLPSRSFPAHVLGLARSCYESFPTVNEQYAILADALEELGAMEAANHCRQAVHAKGCHILDWILQKE